MEINRNAQKWTKADRNKKKTEINARKHIEAARNS